MNFVDIPELGINEAYKTVVKRLYDGLMVDIMNAGDDESAIEAAVIKFGRGFQLAKRTAEVAHDLVADET